MMVRAYLILQHRRQARANDACIMKRTKKTRQPDIHHGTAKAVGIGVDIVDINRFDLDRTRDAHFLKRIFSAPELKYCFGRPDAAPHLAVRFATKEATVKALASLGLKVDDWTKLEIERAGSGLPRLKLSKYPTLTTQVSLSHNRTTAIAFVVIAIPQN